jgi:hypothetical protein
MSAIKMVNDRGKIETRAFPREIELIKKSIATKAAHMLKLSGVSAIKIIPIKTSDKSNFARGSMR